MNRKWVQWIEKLSNPLRPVLKLFTLFYFTSTTK
ncbi:hypothetical protein BVRB_2g046700 [Beta vulgaris subsp. vulgaris]|nr:hypothetical protein BVRB_2g046700 [Beta vulgaris subsp. vulgaris]